MEIKNGEFAFSPLEAAGRLHDNPPSWTFDPRSHDCTYEDRVEQMKSRGWDNARILKKCTNFEFPNHDGTPLTILVYFNHPIVKEWDVNDIRKAMFTMAQNQIAKNKILIFNESFRLPEERYFSKFANLEINCHQFTFSFL